MPSEIGGHFKDEAKAPKPLAASCVTKPAGECRIKHRSISHVHPFTRIIICICKHVHLLTSLSIYNPAKNVM